MKLAVLLLALKILWPPDISSATGAKCVASQNPKAQGCDESLNKCETADFWRVLGYVRHGQADGQPVMNEMVESRKKAVELCSKFQNAFDKRVTEELKAR